MKLTEEIAQLNKRGWFIKYNKKKIHYFSGGRSLCHKNLKFDLLLIPTMLTKIDSRPCKTCVKRLSDWSDLDNFDDYYSD